MSFIHTKQQQCQRWIGHAMRAYRVETIGKRDRQKMVFGALDWWEREGAARAREHIYRKMRKRWLYLHDDEVREFIEREWGVVCEDPEQRYLEQTA